MGDKREAIKFINKFANTARKLSHDHQWEPSEYVVSEKADGPRCLILCSCDGSVWCVRPQKQSWKNHLSALDAPTMMSALIPKRVCCAQGKCTFVCMQFISLPLQPSFNDANIRKNTWILNEWQPYARTLWVTCFSRRRIF